jgi:hypothetical protein
MNKMADRGISADVTESMRGGKWIFLCPRCKKPRTKTNDPQIPAMILVDDNWVCPTCKCWVPDANLYGE